jgi:hypothetical protein
MANTLLFVQFPMDFSGMPHSRIYLLARMQLADTCKARRAWGASPLLLPRLLDAIFLRHHHHDWRCG